MSKKDLNIVDSVTSQVEAPHVSKSLKDRAKEKVRELIAEETKMVRGIFQCFETPGSTVEINVRKYPGIEPFRKSMTDGFTYEVPLYVARFLNGIDVSAGALGDPARRNTMIGTCSYAVHGFVMASKNAEPAFGAIDGQGIPVPMVGVSSRVKRYGFQSMEFAGAF